MSGDSCIVVSGEGVAFGVPDRCLLSVAFNVLRETPAEAVAAVATVVDAAIGALRDAGVDAANIRTLNLAVRDWFDQRSQQVTARVATYALVVSNRRLDEVSRLLDALAAAAGESLQIQGLMLTVADDSSLRANARRSAVQDATTRARQLADAAGVRLGPIVTIEEAAVPGPRGGFEFSARQVAATAAAPMPVEAGTAAVTVRITMTFAIDAGDSAPQSAPLH